MKCIITDIDTLCESCGYFDNQSIVNNGYGCLHKDCGDGEFLNHQGEYISNTESKIAISLTTRNIRCSKRLAKKFINKVRSMSEDERNKRLERLGIKFYGKCYPSVCPIAWTVDFDNLKEPINNYVNAEDFDHIETEEDMPWGFGDDLMGIEKYKAEKLGINY